MIWHTIAKGLKCEQVPVQLILNEFRALGGIRGRQAHRDDRRKFRFLPNMHPHT